MASGIGGSETAVYGKDSVMEKVVQGSGKTHEEIAQMVAEKRKRFEGLLTDSGALFMVARELGVELELERNLPASGMKLSQLEAGMQNVDLVARAMHIFAPREFEKNGKRGVLCNMVVADSSAEMRLTLWHRDVKKLEELCAERGAIMALKGCRVGAYNGKAQLDLGFGGDFSLAGASSERLPECTAKPCKLSELTAGQQNVDAYARVARIFGEREFEKEGRRGKVVNFEIADEGAVVRAAAWNEIADSVKKLKEGDPIKIEGAYTKEGMRGIELNLGWQARIVRNPKHKLGEVMKGPAGGGIGAGTKYEGKKISELAEGANAELLVKIAEVQQGNLRYNICPKCGKKLEGVAGGWVCSVCGEIEKPDINPVVGFDVEDASGRMGAVAFGSAAERIMGIGKEDLEKRLRKDTPEEIIDDFAKAIEGSEFTLRGRAKKNARSGELEFVVNEAAEA
ncbi:MAG: hypothetical protein V1676_04605 [Candidatus Diapherotrites archaeon]